MQFFRKNISRIFIEDVYILSNMLLTLCRGYRVLYAAVFSHFVYAQSACKYRRMAQCKIFCRTNILMFCQRSLLLQLNLGGLPQLTRDVIFVQHDTINRFLWSLISMLLSIFCHICNLQQNLDLRLSSLTNIFQTSGTG